MLQPHFLKTPQGNIFIQSFVPENPNGDVVLFIPPFAEEMNKSRRMMALLGRSLSTKGTLMVIPDLYGTGDSEGDFSDANWTIWQNNLELLVQKLQEDGVKTLSLVGLRMGCLLINDIISKYQIKVKDVIFWKPVTSGKQMINQFLRLRVANSMMDGLKETTTSLREKLASESELEVAGYGLNAGLVSDLDEQVMANKSFDDAINWHWFEVLAANSQSIPIASTKLIEGLSGRGIKTNLQQFVGENFWANQEIAEVPELISATSRILCEAVDGR